MSITSVRLTSDVERPLDFLAKKLDRSKSYLINQAVREFVARQSVDDSRWEQTLKAIESINSGKSIDESDVNSWLNSWGTDDAKAAPHG
jgi:predicted transcriptional regulator